MAGDVRQADLGPAGATAGPGTQTERLVPGAYAVEPSRSVARVRARTLGFVPVQGVLPGVRGHVQIEPRIEQSTATVAVQTHSFESGLAVRDAHVRSRHLLSARNHPELWFVAEEIQWLGGDRYALHGGLTIRGATEPVVFTVTLEEVVRSADNVWLRTVATGRLDRRAFDLPPHEPLALWGLVVSPHVDVEVEVVARRID